MAVSTLRSYLEVPVADDPHYTSIELQWLEAEGVEGFAVLLTDHAKTVDAYVDRCLGLGDEWFSTDPAISNVARGEFVVRTFSGDVDAAGGDDENAAAVDATVSQDRIAASVRLVDRHGRLVAVDVSTDPRKGSPRGAFVIPSPPHQPTLHQLPFLMNRDFFLMAQEATTVDIAIDGQSREAVSFWFPLGFRRRLLARFASGVSMVGLNPIQVDAVPDTDFGARDGGSSPVEVAVDDQTTYLMQPSAGSKNVWGLLEVRSRGGLDELRMTFEPPLYLGEECGLGSQDGKVAFIQAGQPSGTGRFEVRCDGDIRTIELRDLRQHWPVSIRRFGVFALSMVRRLNRPGSYRWSASVDASAGITSSWFDRDDR